VNEKPVKLFSFATVLFAALAFVVALLPNHSTVDSDSFDLRQGHFLALALSSFVCVIFAGVYYLCSRWLHLSFRAILSSLHFISVFLPLVVFSSLWYLTRKAAVTAQPEPRMLRVYRIDLSIVSNVLAAIFVAGFLLFALNILSALVAKSRLSRKAV
jgi:heme/copper-type cytochrome/quinol oxidase subunit 1